MFGKKPALARIRLAMTLALFTSLAPMAAQAQAKLGGTLASTVAELEQQSGGRIGVSITELSSGQTWSHRAGEHFPLASTFKAFACAHLLDRADQGEVDIHQRVRFAKADLQTYSPVTKDRVDGNGMSLFELCDATTSMSDNTAANLILKNTGGPAALTRFMRSLGDETTRLDRFEPELNDVGPGEVHDTTSPAAAAASLQALVLGHRLGAASRAQLTAWLVANQVGGPLLRASLPDGWTIADRTGSGEYGSRGIIAVIWPKPAGTGPVGPVIAAVYLTGTTLSLDARSAIIARIGAAMVKDLTR